MHIGQLTHATEDVVRDISVLLSQLRENTPEQGTTFSELSEVIGDKNTVCVVAEDGGRIVGMATLYILKKFGKRIAHVEDVVVHSDYRGKGLGKSIMQAVIEAAREKKVHTIGLTSRPAREAANKLYQKLGFERKETNVYRMKLN